MNNAPLRLDRRSMMLGSGLMIAGFTTSRMSSAGLHFLGQTQSIEEKDLNFLTTDPRNGEPELDKLVQSWITPTELFYVRSHAPNPEIDEAEFRLKIDGMVDRELSLSMEDIKSLPEHEVTATLTCAGNRRTEFNKEEEVGGVQWGPGAIGNATWRGVRLEDVLNQAGVDLSAKHVWFEGLDEIEKGEKTIGFGASIPLEKAMARSGVGGDDSIPGAMLCYSMNGQPLTADHGFPLRALVPGYIGARSVKWLGKVTVSDRPSSNHYVQTAYKIVRSTDPLSWQEAGPIYRFPINAAFAHDAQTTLKPGPLTLVGYVLPSGRDGARVRRVHVTANGGESWTQAEFIGEENEYCWRLWKAEVEITDDTTELVARAVDTTGAFMPARVRWNAKGYMQNSWYRVPVSVES